MPAIVGPIYIMSLAGDAAASFGDVFAISPKAVDHSGAGGRGVSFRRFCQSH